MKIFFIELVFATYPNKFQTGPYFLPRFNGETCAEFLVTQILILLENVSLRARETLIFQHDGVLVHFSRRVREILNERFPDRWMGRVGPII